MQNISLTIKQILNRWQINEIAFLDCTKLFVINEKYLKNYDFKTCILFIIPYRTTENNPKWISKYAAPLDYHYFCKEMFECVEAELKQHFPDTVFKGFIDNSPINERAAAAMSGLGFIGDNKLFISHRYGSYVFIGEILTDLPFEFFSDFVTKSQPTECNHCGACESVCPTNVIKTGEYQSCLSFISQKKHKTIKELELLYKHKTAWGCDICQNCCPHNRVAEKSEIPFFSRELVNEPSSSLFEAMNDEVFLKRAFSWRGKNTILENIKYFEEQEQKNQVLNKS